MTAPGDNPAHDRASMVVAMWVLATVALLFFLRYAAQLLIPIAIGMVISYALEPVVAWLARHHVPRLAGTGLVLLSLTAASAWGAYTLRDDVAQWVETLPDTVRRARELVARQSNSGAGASLREAAQELRGGQATGTAGPADPSASASTGRDGSHADAASKRAPAAPADGGDGATDLGLGGAGSAASVAGLAQQGVNTVMSAAGNLLVVFFLVFFLLASGHHFRRRLIEIAGPALERRQVTAAVIDDINEQIQRFLLVRLVTAIIVGAATWGVLAWMQVSNAAVWGILAGVFNSIPYFGPVIVSGGLLVVGLVQGGGLAQAVQMSGAALVITSLEGWVLTPPLMGKAERMSALAVFFGILLWTWLWGAWGTILAVPMLVVVKAAADHIESLRPLGRLMAP